MPGGPELLIPASWKGTKPGLYQQQQGTASPAFITTLGQLKPHCQPTHVTHHNHDVPQPAAVEVPHHLRVVLKAFLVEGEIPLGIGVIQVVPLHVLWMEARVLGEEQGPHVLLWDPHPTGLPSAPHGRCGQKPREQPRPTRGKRAAVMLATTCRVMSVEE